jgi:hypothetical protein
MPQKLDSTMELTDGGSGSLEYAVDIPTGGSVTGLNQD